jgi:hypothetical protein
VRPLERRYRRLLAAYPPAYRRDHESEILGTLLEAAAPGQRWPSAREGAALLVGGLRTGARLTAQSPHRVWADGLRLGTLLILVRACGTLTARSIASPPVGWVNGSIPHPLLWYLEAVVAAVAMVLVLRGRFRVGVAAILALLALQVVRQVSASPMVPPGWLVPADWLGLGAIVTVLGTHRALRGASRPWSWRQAALLLLAFAAATLFLLVLSLPAVATSSEWLVLGRLVTSVLGFVPLAALIAIALLAADARPALAAAVIVAADVLTQVQTLALVPHLPYFPWAWHVFEASKTLLLGAGAATASILIARRRTAT